MPTSIFDPAIAQTLAAAQTPSTRQVQVDGQTVSIPVPFPSPGDWRNCWIYFLITDRFNNPSQSPKLTWNQSYGFWQGGTFEGVRQQLPYLQKLGVRAIWLSPVVKNSRPEIDGFAYVYPGYNAQDFLNVDARFASDGAQATAETELSALVNEAHARGIYVILDIVLNHAGRVFDYQYDGNVTSQFTDPTVMNAPLGQEPPIQWMTGIGVSRQDWTDTLPVVSALSADDAVWPTDLQRKEFFRRRGSTLSNTPTADGFVHGDFGSMRQMVHEYTATSAGQQALRQQYGSMPVISILIRAYEYLLAKYDFDGFRIDTVKYIRPDIVETFGNAVREYALSIGKADFFTYGEIYDSEQEIDQFIGRNTPNVDGFGIDAALDFPLFFNLPSVIKGFSPVESVRAVFTNRKSAEAQLISSHGDAGKYFVSFLDNHDQNQRFNTPGMPVEQVLMGVAVLFGLQGIPCLYYGTEQGLQGTVDTTGKSTLNSMESVREALWGKPSAFDTTSTMFQHIAAIVAVRSAEAPLRYGRLYFREVAGNGTDFGQSTGAGGVVAFSRILTDREILIVANTSFGTPFSGSVLVDYDLSGTPRTFKVAYSNLGTSTTMTTSIAPGKVYPDGGGTPVPRDVASLPVSLKPMEVQILTPM